MADTITANTKINNLKHTPQRAEEIEIAKRWEYKTYYPSTVSGGKVIPLRVVHAKCAETLNTIFLNLGARWGELLFMCHGRFTLTPLPVN